MLSNFLNELRAIYRTLIVYYPDTKFGNKLRVSYWARQFNLIQPKFIGRGVIIKSPDKFHIGKNFIAGENVVIENANSHGCYIGGNVGLARGVYIRTANHKISDINKSWMDQGHESKEIFYNHNLYSVVIEDDVWVGASAVLLSGAHIEKGAIISAGAIVSGHIPEYSIVVGNPGRAISNRIKNKLHRDALNKANE
jgi:acetyltransferase-like isoleucine patch superfamily enzyme